MGCRCTFFIPVILAAMLVTTLPAKAEENTGAIQEIPFHSLSDRNISNLGLQALAIRPNEWKHAETKNFVYHYFQSFIATPVSVEAEFYYRVIAKDLEKETAQWERKSHIYIFEKPDDWTAFKSKAALDPWTGGIHSNGDLFVIRNPAYKFKGDTLGHEVAHLVVFRFFGNGIPLWLNEGYAEFAASRGYAAFYRARGYSAKPTSQAVNPNRFIPLADLIQHLTYPSDVLQVETFYFESQRLVRFLSALDKRGFTAFFDAMSKGNRFETALSKGFGNRYPNMEALEREFKTYATKDHEPGSQD